VTYQWNLDGKNDFPVKVIGSHSLSIGGRQANKESFAQNANELTSIKDRYLSEMKAAIDAEINAQPKSKYTQNQPILTGVISYRSGSYSLTTYMNTNGTADFPAKVTGVYRLPSGSDQSV